MGLKIRFLGTGTSQGVPVIACFCEVCTSSDPKDDRLRTSIYVETPEASLAIDAGPDFRQQMLRERVTKLDAVVFTHEHKDHVAGLDDVRAFNFSQKKSMDVYCTEGVSHALKREFHYVFADTNYPGVPRLDLNIIDKDKFSVNGLELQPIEVMHYKLPVLGFRIKDFTYITDAKTISEAEKDKIRGSKVLVLNALRHHEHISHFTLEEAIALAKDINAERTYFTHISHYLGTHQEVSKDLPKGMELAYDGLILEM